MLDVYPQPKRRSPMAVRSFPFWTEPGACEPGELVSDWISDDHGPDCPNCGAVHWECGDHYHNGVCWIGSWTRTLSGKTYYGVECPKCHSRWKLIHY